MHKGRVIYLTDYEESFPIAGERERLETDKFGRFRLAGKRGKISGRCDIAWIPLFTRLPV